MNKLTTEKRAQIVGCLVEGMSIRATVRVTGAAKNTVTKLLVELGQACSEYQDRVLRDLPCKRIECDEIWSFVGCKEKNVPADYDGPEQIGSVWTWTAIDADTKLACTWLVGERNLPDAKAFIADLASRLRGRIQLTTDGFRPYVEAVEEVFGEDVDYTMLVKLYGMNPDEGKYSPVECLGAEKHVIKGNPDLELASTSYVERQNLTMRMGMRRFTRLTNAFSKKAENLAAAVSLHFMYYNFARKHTSLSKPYPQTPAMAAGAADHVWTLAEIVSLLDAQKVASN
jgi:IS1 family transposase